MLHAVVCRTLFTLGAHVNVPASVAHDVPLSSTEREDRHLRWLLWLSYVFDKVISLRTGQPYLLHDESCDLTLPHNYAQRRFARETESHDRRGPPYTDHGKDPLLPCDLRLSIIKSRACRLLYSASALRKPETELLRSIRELDEEMEAWRASLSTDFAPSLSMPRPSMLPLSWSMPTDMHHVEVHLGYHHLLSVIHHASGRYQSLKTQGIGEAGASIIESSLELSVQASRSTLIYLSVAVHGLASGAAW